MRDVATYRQNWIGGEWVDGGAGRIDVVDPGTGEHLAAQALADAADVDRAVAAARACYESGALSDLCPVERGRMVQAMGRYGREKGREALWNYVQTKNIAITLGGAE